jgi:hypothetical protein
MGTDRSQELRMLRTLYNSRRNRSLAGVRSGAHQTQQDHDDEWFRRTAPLSSIWKERDTRLLHSDSALSVVLEHRDPGEARPRRRSPHEMQDTRRSDGPGFLGPLRG